MDEAIRGGLISIGRRLIYLMFFLQGCAAVTPPYGLQGLDPSVGQAIYVHPIKKGSIQAQLSAWQRQNHGWRRQYSVRAVIGRNGLAQPGRKKEGDGKTPSGVYPLGPAFGYAAYLQTGLEYRQATENDFWVDDPRSLQYNQWVSRRPEAQSYEHMRRPDNLYRYGIVIGYNMHPAVAGAGSAIFMHVWRSYRSATAGCVALNERNLCKILKWLDRRFSPVIILQ